jgi:hypothetical protein
VRPESTLGLPLVAALGLEMGILEEKPQDLECASLKPFKSLIALNLVDRSRTFPSVGIISGEFEGVDVKAMGPYTKC